MPSMKVHDFAPDPLPSPSSTIRSGSPHRMERSNSPTASSPPDDSREEDSGVAPAPRPEPISRLLSSSAKLPHRSSSSASSSRPPPSERSSSTTSSRLSHTNSGANPDRSPTKSSSRPKNVARKSSSIRRKKVPPPNIAGPSSNPLQRNESGRYDQGSFVVGGSAGGGGGGSTASGPSQSTATNEEKPPLWAMGGVFPNKERRRSSVARDWAKNREKERKEMQKERDKNRRAKPPRTERMESAITEHSSTIDEENVERGDGGLPSDTIVEQNDPFDRLSGNKTDGSANDDSDMSRGGSTRSRPVKRHDHETEGRDAARTNSNGERENRPKRSGSPGSATLAEEERAEEEEEAERSRRHERDYNARLEKGRNEVERDSENSINEAQGDEAFDQADDNRDDRSEASDTTETSATSSNSAQVGGQLNQRPEDWQEDMNSDGGPPIRNLWGTVRYALREPMAEFLGTMILVVLGVGADCQTKISAESSTNTYFVWGFAVMISVYIAGGISGGHTNPAVTISLALFRGFPWKMVPRYILAQVLGAFVGALMIYGNYKRAISSYDPNKLIHASADPPLNASATLFFTAPAPQVGTTPLGFAQEILAGGILMIAVLALGDENNAPPGAGLGAIVLGFVVVAIGMSNGWVSGYAINPARDIGPRFALWAVGYGTDVWTHDDCWWIFGPLLGPLVGSIGGCLAYDMLIFNGPGSPVNWSTHELAASVGLPQMYNLAKRAAHPQFRHGKSMRVERDLEATLPPKNSVIRQAELTGRDRPGRRGSVERKDLEVVQRWRMGRERHEKQQETNRDKYERARRRKVEMAKKEFLREAQEKSDAVEDAFAAEMDNEDAMDTFTVREKGKMADIPEQDQRKQE